ncbi:MAG: VCBS repeat-containing protein [Acidobacteria bacterium]|nr:VCBS repeat-containing protein [Acidobacteriota bacterium]
MIKMNSVMHEVRNLLIICLIALVGLTTAALGQSRTSRSSQKQIRTQKQKTLGVRKQRQRSKAGLSANFPQPKSEDGIEGDQKERDNWFIDQRKYPFDKLPDEARRRAWLSRPAENSMMNATAASIWQSIGPAPTTSAFPANWGVTSGRINAVAVSPANAQIVLVGGAVGGIWRSTNGGTTFAPVSDTQVDMAVGAIAFAPSDANVVYAAMGDSKSAYMGTGVLRSADAGATWTRVSNASFPTPAQAVKVEIDPTNPNRVYVVLQSTFANGGNGAGFFLSNDGGVSWTNTLSGMGTDLVRHPTEAATLFAAFGFVNLPNTAGGVFKSIDSGASWNRIYTSPIEAQVVKLAIAPSNGQVLYVLAGDNPRPRLEVTTNGGGMWTNRGSATFDVRQFGYNNYVYVSPADPNTVYVGTRDVWRSTDGGVNFTNLNKNFQSPTDNTYTPTQSNAHPDQHSMFISPGAPNTIYIGNDGGVWRATDGGTTFQTLNASLNLSMFVGLSLHPTNAAISYGGTQDNGTQRRTGQSTWQEFFAGDGGHAVIDAVDPSIVFASYVNGYMVRFLNNGDNYDAPVGCETFVTCATFNNDRVAFYPPITGNGLNSNLYIGTYRIYISADRGATWTAPGGAQDLTNGGTVSAIGVGPANPSVIYSGSSDGRVMVSTNAGVNWNPAGTNIPNRSVTSITVSRTNAAVAYLTVSGFGSGHVFKTTNTGGTWTDISTNLPDVPVNTLLVDPRNANTLYVGTDIGIFRSLNDGGAWSGFNSGLPPAVITKITAQQNGLIQAASYGRGAYQLAVTGSAPFDLDGDGKTDLAIFRPGPGEWWWLRSSNGSNGAVTFGAGSDILTPADYTGDGKMDIATFRPSTGFWFVLRSEDFSFYAFPFGANGDVPVPADFDGDGKSDPAVFRESSSTWYINKSSGGTDIFGFGSAGDKTAVADYDGDGKADVAIFRPVGVNGAEWWVRRSSTAVVAALQFGSSTDKAVPGDFTGDGKADIAFWRPSTGFWNVLRSEDLSYFAFPFGTTGDVPVAGDYDGDGKTDAGVFRPSNSTWFIQRSTAGTLIQQFGAAGDVPLPSAFVR